MARDKKVQDDIHAETTNNVPNELQKLDLDSILNKIIDKQKEFENETVRRYNDLVKIVEDIRLEIQKTNPVSNVNTMRLVSNPDENGINWGKDEFSEKGNSQDMLSKFGIDKNTISSIVSVIAQSLLQKNNNNLGNVFMEFMMRDFFENYQRQKLEARAFMNLFVKKGLLNDTDVKILNENTDILNDPLNGFIKKMKGDKG